MLLYWHVYHRFNDDRLTMKLPRAGSFQGLHEREPKAVVVSRHDSYTVGQTTGGLSVLFTILCIVDLFGVFPVVALPKSIISCGLYGIPMVLGVFGLQLYTAVLLGRSWLLAQEITPHIVLKNRFPYAAIAELAFGWRARRLVTFLLDATIFGAGVPNFIFASQSMQLFFLKVSDGGIGVSYCVWMIVIGLLMCPVMWLGSPKDMKPLAFTSVFIVVTVSVLTWSCILTDSSSLPADSLLDYSPSLRNFLVAYGIIAFQFDIHPMLLTLQVDMKDSRKIHWAALGGFAVTGTLFAITATLLANRYGTHVDNNVLQGIPASMPLYVVALLVTLQLCLSSAVSNSALFQHIEDWLQISRDFCLKRCLIRSGIVALAVFLGESVPRFDLVMGLVGSTLTGPLMFIFPPLFFLRLCYIKSYMAKQKQNGGYVNGNTKQNGVDYPIKWSSLQNTYKTFSDNYLESHLKKGPLDQYSIRWFDILLAVLVMLIGITATLVATYSSWSETINSATFTTPCLLNVTAAAMSFLATSTNDSVPL